MKLAVELLLKMADVIEPPYMFMQTFWGFKLSTHHKNFGLSSSCASEFHCYFRQFGLSQKFTGKWTEPTGNPIKQI